MPSKTLVIVGGVAGGAGAAARARRLSEDANIIVFERGPHVSFANCGLPYFIGGKIQARRSLLLHTPATLKQRFNLDVRVNTEVVALDRESKRVKARELDSGREYYQQYDALILSTGAVPVIPSIPGINRPGHFVVRNVPDADAIITWLNEPDVKRAVVVGGGYIGLEMAEQLKRRGLDVTIVEALDQVLATFDIEMARMVEFELKRNGIKLVLNNPVVGFGEPPVSDSARASMVVLQDGRKLPADIVILAIGVRPEVSLARDAGLEIGARGGIRVDEHMRTSDPYIWAVGDAVEVRDLVTGEWTLMPLAGPASRQGRIAADNVFGNQARYAGSLGTSIVGVFGVAAACTGATEKRLRQAGIRCEAVHLHPPSHATYYRGASPVALKILFEPGSGRLLGAQAVGRDGVDKRIDVMATAIKAGMTVDDLAELDLAYAPPFGSAKDPVNLAGMVAQNIIRGHARQIHWQDLDNIRTRNALLLDVRTPEERKTGYIPGSVHIPLHELRDRMSELPTDKEIVVYCRSGQRSYYAYRILAQRGYKVSNLSGSYLTWKYIKDESSNNAPASFGPHSAMKPSKKLMVTGARGFVASNLIAQALQDWEVHAVSRGEPLLEHPNLRWHVANPLDESSLARVFAQVMPDAVIHTAAIANIDFCEANPEVARKINVEMTSLLVDLCASSGSKLVFCSTDNVFDGERAPYSEEHLPAPVNVYGQTKFEAERIVAHRSKAAVIARLAFVVGFPAFGHCNSFFVTAVDAIKSGRMLCAPNNEFRTPIDVVSASRALLELAAEEHSGLFHLAGNDRLNRFELLHELARAIGLSPDKITTVDPTQINSRAPRPRDVSLNNRKARSFLRTPMHGFRDWLAMLKLEKVRPFDSVQSGLL